MSNISRIQGLGPLLRRLRCGRVGRPVCERAGYKTQSSFPSTDFLNFFQCSAENQKEPVKSDDRGLFGPKWGPAFRPLWSAGAVGYTGRLRDAQAIFRFECRNLAFSTGLGRAADESSEIPIPYGVPQGWRSKATLESAESATIRAVFPTAECRSGPLRSLREPRQSATSQGRRSTRRRAICRLQPRANGGFCDPSCDPSLFPGFLAAWR